MAKYVSKDGTYLAVDERTNRIGWILPEDGDFGEMIGDREIPKKTKKTSTLHWEAKTVRAAVAPFSCGRDHEGFRFEDDQTAYRALCAANEALLLGNVPLPTWAVTALGEGWKPPKGWKP